jgi:hypothetical protein
MPESREPPPRTKLLVYNCGDPRDILHDPPAWLEIIDDGQELNDVPQAIINVSASTTVGIGKLGARRATDDDLNVSRELGEW